MRKRKIVNRPRGTRDIIFPQTSIYKKVNSVCLEVLNSNNYQQIILPTYEYRELFSSSLGNGTDIVNKEMFVFDDQKGRKLVLRPEGTASIVRAVQQNKLIQSDMKPLKLYYWANMFRYERPQDGRYREF